MHAKANGLTSVVRLFGGENGSKTKLDLESTDGRREQRSRRHEPAILSFGLSAPTGHRPGVQLSNQLRPALSTLPTGVTRSTAPGKDRDQAVGRVRQPQTSIDQESIGPKAEPAQVQPGARVVETGKNNVKPGPASGADLRNVGGQPTGLHIRIQFFSADRGQSGLGRGLGQVATRVTHAKQDRSGEIRSLKAIAVDYGEPADPEQCQVLDDLVAECSCSDYRNRQARGSFPAKSSPFEPAVITTRRRNDLPDFPARLPRTAWFIVSARRKPL